MRVLRDDRDLNSDGDSDGDRNGGRCCDGCGDTEESATVTLNRMPERIKFRCGKMRIFCRQ